MWSTAFDSSLSKPQRQLFLSAYQRKHCMFGIGTKLKWRDNCALSVHSRFGAFGLIPGPLGGIIWQAFTHFQSFLKIIRAQTPYLWTMVIPFQLIRNWYKFFFFLDNQGKCSAELSRRRDEIANFSPEDIWFNCTSVVIQQDHLWRRKWRSVVSLLLKSEWNRLYPSDYSSCKPSRECFFQIFAVIQPN